MRRRYHEEQVAAINTTTTLQTIADGSAINEAQHKLLTKAIECTKQYLASTSMPPVVNPDDSVVGTPGSLAGAIFDSPTYSEDFVVAPRPGVPKKKKPTRLPRFAQPSSHVRVGAVKPKFCFSFNTDEIIADHNLADRGQHKNAAIARALWFTALTGATGGFVTVRCI